MRDRDGRPAGRRDAGGPRQATPLWIVLGLALGPAVALGLARFAYALLMPAMRADLGWSYAEAGAMNTANAVGYLVGALAAAPIGSRFGLRPSFAGGVAATALAVAACGLTRDFGVLLLLRVLSGLTGAVAFVAGGALAAAAGEGGPPSRAPAVLGLYFAGSGLGVAASALAVPPLLDARGWQDGWLALAGLGALAAVAAAAAGRRAPSLPASSDGPGAGGWSARALWGVLAGQALFGAGYIAYATFIVAYLRTVEGFSTRQVSLFWALLGLAAVAAAFAWAPVLARLRGGWGAAATIWTVALGAALPLLSGGAAAAYASALVFGFSFLAVIAAVTSFARRAVRPQAWTSAIAALTVAFGIGQTIGPILGGALSDGPNGLRAGLWLSVGILVAGGAVAALQPDAAGDGRAPRVTADR